MFNSQPLSCGFFDKLTVAIIVNRCSVKAKNYCIYFF